MQLPVALAAAVERELDGVPLADLQRAADRLSQRYRAELRDGALHVADELAARAYLATRLPATYAAVRASLEHAATAMPGFSPERQLDIGSGPGTAGWAAADCWPSLSEATLVEASAAMRLVGDRLMRNAPVRIDWLAGDITADRAPEGPADLVTLAYVLDELSEGQRDRLVDRLWAATTGMLVIVEPGTPAGLAARPGGAGAAGRARLSRRSALPPRGALPDHGTRLVPFRPACRPIEGAQADQARRRSLRGRKIRLCRSGPRPGGAIPIGIRARARTAPRRQRQGCAEALPSGWTCDGAPGDQTGGRGFP